MKKNYNTPATVITFVKMQRQLLNVSGANQSGLSGASSAEYTGGGVNWSRENSSWEDNED